MFIMEIDLNGTLGTQIDRTLAGVFASPVKNYLLVGVVLWVLSQIVVVLYTVPYHTHSCEILGRYLVRKVNES